MDSFINIYLLTVLVLISQLSRTMILPASNIKAYDFLKCGYLIELLIIKKATYRTEFFCYPYIHFRIKI